MPRPIRTADFGSVEGVFTDVDGTLTDGGLLTPRVLKALADLRGAGVRVVLVTGRPAGYGECWLRTLPVDGVIAENGGLYFVAGKGGGMRKVYAERQLHRRAEARRRLQRGVAAVLRQVEGARLSNDSLYAEVDLALDYNEDCHLGARVAEQMIQGLRASGLKAVRSSVHVNTWAGRFDKLATAKRFLVQEWRTRLVPQRGRFVYVGDSLNDESMFKAFELSIGVANVRDVLTELKSPPQFITRAREGRGFAEVARAILRAKRAAR